MMFDKIGLIGVPSSAGAHGVGQEKASQALRRAGLVTGMESSGSEVVDFGDLPLALYHPQSANRKQQNLSHVVDVARRVTERVDEVLRQQLTPVVIGGEYSYTVQDRTKSCEPAPQAILQKLNILEKRPHS